MSLYEKLKNVKLVTRKPKPKLERKYTTKKSVTAESFDGLKLVLRYEMRNERGEKVFTARSEHAFLNREGRIVRMDRDMPAFRAALEAAGEQS